MARLAAPVAGHWPSDACAPVTRAPAASSGGAIGSSAPKRRAAGRRCGGARRPPAAAMAARRLRRRRRQGAPRILSRRLLSDGLDSRRCPEACAQRAWTVIGEAAPHSAAHPSARTSGSPCSNPLQRTPADVERRRLRRVEVASQVDVDGSGVQSLIDVATYREICLPMVAVG